MRVCHAHFLQDCSILAADVWRILHAPTHSSFSFIYDEVQGAKRFLARNPARAPPPFCSIIAIAISSSTQLPVCTCNIVNHSLRNACARNKTPVQRHRPLRHIVSRPSRSPYVTLFTLQDPAPCMLASAVLYIMSCTVNTYYMYWRSQDWMCQHRVTLLARETRDW